MKLKDIFDQLATGELSQISLGGAPMGEISEESYPKLVRHVNLALTALYKRFPLRECEMSLLLKPDRELYYLRSDFIIGNPKSREPVRYLEIDPLDPFKDDLLKVDALEMDSGKEMLINMTNNPLSAMTYSTTKLGIPLAIVNQDAGLHEDYQTSKLRVKYRASHPEIRIPLGLFDPARVTVQLPDAYMEALLLFIASRVHTPVGMSGEGQVGNNWFAKYEAECQQLENQNLGIDRFAENTRLERGGWV